MAHKPKINLKIWIPVAAVILLIAVSGIFLMTSSTTVAALNIEEGNVQVDVGKGWVAAMDGMELSREDKVKTLDGKAVLVLYESILIEMDENTEISIEQLSKENTKIRQESGSTWNKFAAIAGIQSFEVETPTTVATVRGTDFWVDMNSVGVAEGLVDVKMAGKKMQVKPNFKATRDGTNVIPFDQKDIQRAIIKKEKMVQHLQNLRQKEIEKHKATYNLVKKLKGWTDEDVNRYMTRLDNGEFDENQIRQRSILPAKSIDKFAKISSEIKRQKADVNKLRQLKPASAETLPEEVGPVEMSAEPKPKTTERIGNTVTGMEGQRNSGTPLDTPDANTRDAQLTNTLDTDLRNDQANTLAEN
jgi:hypothetical protein